MGYGAESTQRCVPRRRQGWTDRRTDHTKRRPCRPEAQRFLLTAPGLGPRLCAPHARQTDSHTGRLRAGSGPKPLCPPGPCVCPHASLGAGSGPPLLLAPRFLHLQLGPRALGLEEKWPREVSNLQSQSGSWEWRAGPGLSCHGEPSRAGLAIPPGPAPPKAPVTGCSSRNPLQLGRLPGCSRGPGTQVTGGSPVASPSRAQ